MTTTRAQRDRANTSRPAPADTRRIDAQALALGVPHTRVNTELMRLYREGQQRRRTI